MSKKKTQRTINQLAQRTHTLLDPENYTMTCECKNYDDSIHLEYTFGLDEDNHSIVCDRQIDTIKAFARLAGAFSWYITKDFSSGVICFKIQIAIDK